MPTIEQIVIELERLNKQAKYSFAKYVEAGTMSPFTRDSRLAIYEYLLKQAQEAQQEKTTLKTKLKKAV